MTNMQNIRLIKIVSYVPDSKIWRIRKFIWCADGRCYVSWWSVYCRNPPHELQL